MMDVRGERNENATRSFLWTGRWSVQHRVELTFSRKKTLILVAVTNGTTVFHFFSFLCRSNTKKPSAQMTSKRRWETRSDTNNKRPLQPIREDLDTTDQRKSLCSRTIIFLFPIPYIQYLPLVGCGPSLGSQNVTSLCFFLTNDL